MLSTTIIPLADSRSTISAQTSTTTGRRKCRPDFTVGPGFGRVGPVENYSEIPLLGKWLLAWCMLLGRLEFYTLLVLLVPGTWVRSSRQGR